ncbi:MAG: hypothetical protein ACLTSZ_08135 [Lachnospiraceae bacterium]
MYRKSLAAALTATMVGSMFFDGSRAEEAKEYSDPDNRSAGLEITFMGIFLTEDLEQDNLLEDAVARFTADYPNIKRKRSSSAE